MRCGHPEFASNISCSEGETGLSMCSTSFIARPCSLLTPVSWVRAFVTPTPRSVFGPGGESLSRGRGSPRSFEFLRHLMRTRRAGEGRHRRNRPCLSRSLLRRRIGPARQCRALPILLTSYFFGHNFRNCTRPADGTPSRLSSLRTWPMPCCTPLGRFPQPTSRPALRRTGGYRLSRLAPARSV